MIPKATKSEVYTNFEQNEQNTSYASVQMNKEMFKLLSSDIYRNKIRALIRELLTNAVDSHVAANTLHKKIKIKAPTSLDPQFSVRDYGTGLSDEMVHKCFLSYGFSTKRDSNDFNGQFGIGAKVTFSYSQSFMITSFFEGVKTIFNLYINESGIPTSTVVYKESTDEENGIEISISIFKEDFNQFEREIHHVLAIFMKGEFEVHGISNQVVPIKDTIEMLSENMGIIPIVYATNPPQTRFCVVQENVMYPLDETRMMNILEGVNLISDETYTFSRKFTLVLFAENGTLSYTASREEIENTQENYDYIEKELFKDFHLVCEKYIVDRIKKINNQFEACIFDNNINDMFIMSDDLEAMKFREHGFYCNSNYFFKDIKDFISDYGVEFTGSTLMFNVKKDANNEPTSLSIHVGKIIEKRIKIFIVDDKKKWKLKLSFIKNNREKNDTTYIVIKNYEHFQKNGLPDYFTDCGDYIEIIMASAITLETTVREKPGKWFCQKANLIDMVRLDDLVDQNEKVYVVYISNGGFYSKFLNTRTDFNMHIFYSLNGNFFYEHEKIIFARNSRKPNIENRHPNCVDAFDELVKRIKNKHPFSDFESLYKYNNDDGVISYSVNRFLETLFEKIPNAPMNEIYKEYVTFIGFPKSIVDTIFKFFDLKIIYEKDYKVIANEIETIYNYYMENYPLIVSSNLSYSVKYEPKVIDNIKQLLGVE